MRVGSERFTHGQEQASLKSKYLTTVGGRVWTHIGLMVAISYLFGGCAIIKSGNNKNNPNALKSCCDPCN